MIQIGAKQRIKAARIEIDPHLNGAGKRVSNCVSREANEIRRSQHSNRTGKIRSLIPTTTVEVIMRIAIYARVSTDDRGQDPENQLRELRAWCGNAAHEIVHEYVDHESGRKGVTNSHPNRRGLACFASFSNALGVRSDDESGGYGHFERPPTQPFC